MIGNPKELAMCLQRKNIRREITAIKDEELMRLIGIFFKDVSDMWQHKDIISNTFCDRGARNGDTEKPGQ